MKNLKKKVRFRINLKSKHLLAIMTIFCISCIVATFASGITTAPLQDAAEALLRMNDNDIENARRYKSKKSRLLNEDELAGTIEYDAAAHQYDIIRTDTGDIYSQNTLSDWTCQGG